MYHKNYQNRKYKLLYPERVAIIFLIVYTSLDVGVIKFHKSFLHDFHEGHRKFLISSALERLNDGHSNGLVTYVEVVIPDFFVTNTSPLQTQVKEVTKLMQ